MQTSDQSVALTVLAQLGRVTLAMIGANGFVSSTDSISFKIRGSTKVSHIRITLTPADTYTVKFQKVRGRTVKDVSTDEDVYCDSLHGLIESRTGLCTRF